MIGKRLLYFAFYNHLFLSSVSFLFAAEEKKVVVPFDFVSRFDNGRYGRMMGDMLWKKLSQESGFIVPESMIEVREYCESRHIDLSPEMTLDEIQKIVRGDFDAAIGIWGSVERAPDAASEIYDLHIRCVDFSTKPDPKIIYEVAARTNSVSEIPHVYVKQLLDALCDRKTPAPSGVDSVAAEYWKNNPNLISGDFQSGNRGVPSGWERVCGQQREPLGRLVRWMAEEGNPDNRVIHFSLDRDVAENEGLMYYSDLFPVEEGAAYRFQCRWRSKGPAVKVFIKCYDEIKGEYAPDRGAKLEIVDSHKLREVYRSQQNLSKPTDAWTWQTHTEDFTPKHTRYSPKQGRIMLYAYMVPGEVEFDDVVVKQIVPPPPRTEPKVLRHSTDSKITVEEMKENERRSREFQRKESEKK